MYIVKISIQIQFKFKFNSIQFNSIQFNSALRLHHAVCFACNSHRVLLKISVWSTVLGSPQIHAAALFSTEAVAK